MATADFLDRLSWIAGEGSRQTQYDQMRGARNRNKRDFMQELENQKKRMIEFAVSIPHQNYQDQRVQPGTSGGGKGMPDLNGRPTLGYPIHGKFRISSDFGPRTNPVSHKHSNHTGVDFAAGLGTPIYAPYDAVVRNTDFNKIYGNRTIIDYGGGYSSMFGHQSKFAVKPGQRIRAGQVIGYVGSTGWSTGPHLHFETWINNTPVNPLSWFA